MEALLVRDLVLRGRAVRKKWNAFGVIPEPPLPPDPILKSMRFCKKAELPFPPCDGMVIQDEHMCMQVDGIVYDLKDESLLVRMKAEMIWEEEQFDSSLSYYAALGWLPFPTENKEKTDDGSDKK